jgi:hypothetical protein
MLLQSLDLSGCRINHLPKHTFQRLRQLRNLDLSNNAMTSLDKDVLLQMPFLQKLSLGRYVEAGEPPVRDPRLLCEDRPIYLRPLASLAFYILQRLFNEARTFSKPLSLFAKS